MRTRTSLPRTTCSNTRPRHPRTACLARLLPLLLCTLPAQVQAGDFAYETHNATITITNYTGRGGAVNIPSKIENWTVTAIGDRVFKECKSLTSVNIPDSVTNIGFAAFFDCASLTSVILPDSVTAIGTTAFAGCASLTNISIGSSVTTIGTGAFPFCPKLRAITVNALNPFFVSVDGVLFNKQQTTLVAYPAAKAGRTFEIPNSVTSIGNWAFHSCGSLTRIRIPGSVSRIGDGAFYGCDNLASVTIPNSVTNIGEYAFCFCADLTSVTIPDNVTSIGSDAFRNCQWLTNVTIGNSVTRVGDRAFWFCSSLTGVHFKGNAPSLGSSVFDGADKTTVYYLPGTKGWGATFGGRPTAIATPPLGTRERNR